MLNETATEALPRIVIAEGEEARLTALATAAALTGNREAVARALLAEMERAEVVRDSEVPADIVRMYSTVDFETDGREPRRVKIVFPAEANIDQGCISILTPIGTALIGLSPGQEMAVQGPDGREHTLRVRAVTQPLETN